MPLFAYVCEACQGEAELLVRGGEAPACPACGSDRLTKQASRFAALPAAASRPEPAGCGKQSCCMMQGGCGLN